MSTNELSAKHMAELIDAHRCLRCGKEDKYAGKGGWSGCFTICDDCWPEPAKSAVEPPISESHPL